MKALFALASFYPEHRAGTETYVLNLSIELKKLGYDVFILTPSVGKPSEFYMYQDIGVYTFSVPLKVSVKEMNGLEKPSGIDEFKKLLKEIKPDIFHLHSLSRSLHAEHLKIAAEMGIKTVFTAHLGGSFCVNGDLQLFGKKQCEGHAKSQLCLACFINRSYKFNDFVSKLLAFSINVGIVNSPLVKLLPAHNHVKYKVTQIDLLKKYCSIHISLANWLKEVNEKNDISNSILIKQGIDSSFIQITQEAKKRNPKIKIIFVGRMHPLKQVETVLEALKEFKEQIDFSIITIPFKDEMEYYKEIKQRFNSLGYTNWYENLSRDGVAKKINNSDILILPSKFEAAPLVILEAFALKVPVIGSDYIAIKEMVNHNVNGLIFKNGDVDCLKEQLDRIINEPELITKLSQNIGNVRTFENVAKEHDRLYRSLIKNDL